MLGRSVLGLVAAGLILLSSGVTAAADDTPDSPSCGRVSDVTGECLSWVVAPGSGGGGRSPGTPRDVGPRTCSYQGRDVPCATGLGVWSSYASSWCRLLPFQPPFEDAVWGGETSGSIYSCTRPGFDGLPDPNGTVLRWLPAAPEAPDPEDLARRLLASIEFEAPGLGMFPRGDTRERMGYVGWNMWLWADPSSSLQWGPVRESISEGGVSVSLTAQVREMVWDMGNGDAVSCGKGRPWAEAATGGRNVASPDCGYVYEEDGYYTVIATSVWRVEWSGGGRSGTLPLSLSREAEIMVGELQSLVAPNR